nr:MAG TPA: hypothetical protein [Caudoviricetes sp.]
MFLVCTFYICIPSNYFTCKSIYIEVRLKTS